MKTAMPLCFIVFFALLAFSCDDDDDGDGVTEMDFRAEFFTALTPIQPTRTCNAPYSAFNNQVGEGAATGLGNFTTTISFCVDGDPTSPTFLEYVNSEGSFNFDNGDRLDFIGESGKVILVQDNPDGYEAMFMDPITFTGGTGRFAGASGEAITDSYVNFLEGGGDRTDHVWTGTLTLIE